MGGKQIKKNSLRRLRSALINNVVDDDLESLKINKAELGSVEFGRLEYTLLNYAFNNASAKCADYFINVLDIQKCKSETHYLSTCKLDKIEGVYDLIVKYYEKVPSKGYVSNRLLQPHKIDDNPSRLDFVSSLLESGFLDHDEVTKTIETNFVSESKKLKIVSLLRDMKLMKLGI